MFTAFLDKEDAINLCLAVPLAYEFAEQMIKLGAARFSGNQHNENWSWNREYFEKMDEAHLMLFYSTYKNNNK